MHRVTLERFSGLYATVRLPVGSPIPPWADGEGFVSISRSTDELSIICLASRVPADVPADRDWACWRFVGPYAFNEVGLALAVIEPLAKANISMLLVSTYDTDHLLLKIDHVASAVAVLHAAGHRL